MLRDSTNIQKTNPDIHAEVQERIECVGPFITSKARNCFNITLIIKRQQFRYASTFHDIKTVNDN